MIWRIIFLGFAATQLAACAGTNSGASFSAAVADAWPQSLGGMPSDVPPRRGTPEYDAWVAARANEAMRPKNGAQNSPSSATLQ